MKLALAILTYNRIVDAKVQMEIVRKLGFLSHHRLSEKKRVLRNYFSDIIHYDRNLLIVGGERTRG